MDVTSPESVTVINPRGIHGTNVDETGAVGGTPANPTDKQRKIFDIAPDRLETLQQEDDSQDAVSRISKNLKQISSGATKRGFDITA